jgi:ketosteroid isomerase-like protein
MTTKEIITKYFDSINNSDWETWVSLFDENIIYDDAVSGKMEGIEAIKQAAKGISMGFKSFKNFAEETVVEENKAMVVCRIDAIAANGKSLNSTGSNFYRIKDGKIVYVASFHDPAPFNKLWE